VHASRLEILYAGAWHSSMIGGGAKSCHAAIGIFVLKLNPYSPNLPNGFHKRNMVFLFFFSKATVISALLFLYLWASSPPLYFLNLFFTF